MKRREDPWNLLFVAGMWFQDLFNYDFRRTEMCIIPYATQLGEISFCAYNTGIGWRNIIENMHKNATVAEWYKEHGKHQIYAKGKSVDLKTYEHSLNIDAEDSARVRVLDASIPQNAAEEEKARRRQLLVPNGRNGVAVGCSGYHFTDFDPLDIFVEEIENFLRALRTYKCTLTGFTAKRASAEE